MYTSYYGMSCNPFLKEKENEYKSQDYKELINRFNYLKEIKGLGVFIGPPGYGKTFTIRNFIKKLNKDLYKVIYISATDNLTVFDFFKEIGNSKDYTIVILIGHPELKSELCKKIYETINQRIIVNYTMNGLSREEIKEYVKTRFEIANVNRNIFSEDALNALYSCSKSSPRRLNSLISDALMLGFQNKLKEIKSEIIMQAKKEMDLE